MSETGSNEHRDTLNSDASKTETEITVSELVTKCDLLQSEAELAVFGLDEALKEKDEAAVRAELEDLVRFETKYYEYYEELIGLCKFANLSIDSFCEKRKYFAITVKNAKKKAYKFRPSSTGNSLTKSETANCNRLKFAKIDFNQFDGKKEDWASFKKLFSTYIHESNELSTIEKHQFLRSKLQGEPATLIETLPIDGSFYEKAWKILLQHYDDPMKKISRHIDALFKFQPTKGQQLRSLITHFRAQCAALNITFAENRSIDAVSQFMIHMFLMKTDKPTRIDWEREVEKKKTFATIDEFMEFMEGRCNAYERAIGAETNPENSEKRKHTGKEAKGKAFLNKAKDSQQAVNIRCFYCNEVNHRTFQCSKFLTLNPEERNTAVRKRRWCPKCFRGNCDRNCSWRCEKCQGHHNTLIHFEKKYSVSSQPGSKPESEKGNDGRRNPRGSNSEGVKDGSLRSATSEKSKFSIALCSQKNEVFEHLAKNWVGTLNSNDEKTTLLATAVILISEVDNCKETREIRALLDPGSNLNFITNDFVRKLNLNCTPTSHRIFGIGNMQISLKKCTRAQISSRTSQFKMNLKLLVVDEIASSIPEDHFSIDDWDFPNYISLADPYFNQPRSVDLLLGADVFWKVLLPRSVKIKNLTSKIFASKFGWLVAGEINSTSKSSCAFLSLENEISKTIEKLWFLDSNDAEDLTSEEMQCEKHFLENFQRDEYGRFVVRLPLKIPRDQLGDSENHALNRFYSLEKKFMNHNNELKVAYAKEIRDYIDQGHMREVQNDTASAITYYIPHQMVIKEESTSTKFRIVFDASAPSSSGLSLNDCLMVGPVVQSDLFSILIRSRTVKYIFSADISQMYRQIRVHDDDVSLLRILWRDDPQKEVKKYELVTVPFGLSSSPYLATRCLKVLSDIEGSEFETAKVALANDCYVDNIFTGGDSIDETVVVRRQLTNLLASGGFLLKKWCANHENILEGIPPENLESKFPCYFGQEHVIKTLGLIWDPVKDIFKTWVHLRQPKNVTKREVLSIISSIFDPFGVLAPVTVLAKLLMQSLWQAKVKWDDTLSNELLSKWDDFSKQLRILENIEVPRCLVKENEPYKVELHGFSDASEKAYSAAIYFRIITEKASKSFLLCAKTKVAPLKSMSVARLELCGALLLVELVESVRKSLPQLNFEITRLWCDSQIALCWINSPCTRWLPFVANRVKKIQEKQGDAIWDYVRTNENPADVASRGLKPIQLQNHKLWWHGPKFLTVNVNSFTQEVNFQPSKIQPIEIRQSRKFLTAALPQKSTYIVRFSKFERLIRVTCWIIRFTINCHWLGPCLTGPLKVFETHQATNVIIRLVQGECFPVELKRLKNELNVENNSKLSSLNVFIDAQNIIRVGGRLENSMLSYEQRFPVILPHDHEFTKLLIKYEHEQNLHASTQAMKSILRRKYWILKHESAIKYCLLRCVKCIRLRADTRAQMMAALPKSRTVPGKVFQTVGVDYSGPHELLSRAGRRQRKIINKAYISVFICFATKAVHLELVSELTSEGFLAAFDRFVGRRGLPVEVWSDNGTNFVGANKTLKELFQFFKENENKIVSETAKRECTWHFIPPLTPSFGGLWEAGVKSVKKHLKAVLQNTLLTYEQYETLLIKIEACLNSRPLVKESNDPNEINALTPGHFLVGGPLTAVPNPDITMIPVNRLKYWQLVTRKMQEFWRRWSNDYLNTLQQRNKWKNEKFDVQIGDVVIIKDASSPPLSWPLGIITKLHPGADNLVRVVTVRMRSGNEKEKFYFREFKRPLTKLIFLPC